MAVSANRSPSPISTRPIPNSRTPETNSTLRRSFSGNPLPRPSNILTNPRSLTPATPANSPADFARRNLISKGSEEKENEKDQNLKPVKVRSPAVSKNSKNFMTPTISAASKVNPSPKKKVLAERNEQVRTSISFSDGKSPFGSVNFSDVIEEIDLNSEMSLNQNKAEDSNESIITNSEHLETVLEVLKKDSSLNSKVPLNSQTSDSLSDMKTMKSRPSGSAMSPIIAPLDADPSLPPYNPKTNYLSPRPQFLHYKPNPRIEVYLHKEKGLGIGEGKRLEEGPGIGEGKRLEESFMSESFSDTETTEEETDESENTQKESGDSSSAEEVEPGVSEPMPISTPISSSTQMFEEIVEVKRVLKRKFFTKSRSFALVLVLLIACLSVSVTDSPVFDSSVYKDLSFSNIYIPSEMVEFAKASFDGFAIKFKQWLANSVSYLSKLIGSLDGVDKLGPIQFSNLTSLLEDPFVDGYLKVEHIEERSEEGEVEIEPLEENVEEEEGEPDVEADNSSEDALEGQSTEEAVTLEAEVIEANSVEAIQNQDQSVEPDSSSEAIQNQHQIDSALPITATPQSDFGFEDQSSQTSPEFRPEVVETVELHQGDNNDLSSRAKIEVTLAEANPESSLEKDSSFGFVQSSQVLDSSPNQSEDKYSVHYVQAISLLVALALVAATVSFYLKYQRTSNPSPTVPVDPLLTKKINEDRPSSQIWPPEVDVVGESCPSEMSSFQTSSSYSNRGLKGTSEAQSQERSRKKIHKRESLASSSEYSMGSPSYGSFTTYEKIPTKLGPGDEEIVTPVRRSSRIKNHQVTSP